MIEQLHAFIMSALDPIGVVLGIFVALGSMLAFAYQGYQHLFGKPRQLRRDFQASRQHTGECIGILILDLLPKFDIEAQVTRHCDKVPALKAVLDTPREIHIRRQQSLKPEDMIGISQELREASAQFAKLGVDSIHCFYGGPAIVAAVVGAEFANRGSFLLYHYNPEGYTNFGPLRPIKH